MQGVLGGCVGGGGTCEPGKNIATDFQKNTPEEKYQDEPRENQTLRRPSYEYNAQFGRPKRRKGKSGGGNFTKKREKDGVFIIIMFLVFITSKFHKQFVHLNGGVASTGLVGSTGIRSLEMGIRSKLH